MARNISTSELLHERLQPVYAQFLKDRNIESGDIDPLTLQAMTKAERHLAAVIEHWLRLNEK